MPPFVVAIISLGPESGEVVHWSDIVSDVVGVAVDVTVGVAVGVAVDVAVGVAVVKFPGIRIDSCWQIIGASLLVRMRSGLKSRFSIFSEHSI